MKIIKDRKTMVITPSTDMKTRILPPTVIEAEFHNEDRAKPPPKGNC